MRERVESSPTFSVILTTYNRPRLLERALESLAAQSFRDFEVVLVNDHGEPVEHLLRDTALSVTYLCLGRNAGVSAARNAALALCRGRYVAYLDDDDVLLPGHLAVHAQAHEAHPGSVVYTDTTYVLADEHGQRTQAPIPSRSGEAFSKEALFVKNYITVNNWTHPRALLEDTGAFDTGLAALEDWELLLRLAARHPFVHVPAYTSEVWMRASEEEHLSRRERRHFPELFRAIYRRHGDLGSDWVRAERLRFLDGLEAELSQAPTGGFNAGTYAAWRQGQQFDAARSAALAPLADALGRACRIEVLVLGAQGDAQALARTQESLRRQTLQPARITVIDGQAGEDTGPRINEAMRQSTADWLLIVAAGDELAPHALLLLADKATADPALTCCYMDEDARLADGYGQPIFKPDLNLDLLRSYPYLGQCLAYRREALAELQGLDTAFRHLPHVDFVFRAIERYGLHTIGHLGEVLHHAATPYAQWLALPGVAGESGPVVAAHLERLGIAHAIAPADLPCVNRVRYLHARTPPVSIIVPTRDQLPMLNGLIDSLLAKTGYTNYELLIVDNDSRDSAARAYLDGIERLDNPQLRVLRWPHPFNYSAINNFAAAQARGEYLVLLNNDTAVLHEDWIEALLNHAQRPEVGIVGAKLHYPDGRIQHGGVVLGLRGAADHPFIGEAMDAPGYMHRLQVDQNYTAVTAACLMIRKSVYDEVGGLDEADFKVSYNDVDLCLKVRQAGYLTVWTPHARLMHEGSVSQTRVDTTAQAAKLERFLGEQRAMYRKWLPQLARDPAYNRNLALDGRGFELDPRRNLAWQPFSQPLLPRLFCVAADALGCGHYRVRQPFLAMQRAGLAEGVIAETHLPPVDMERFGPGTIVLQRQLSDNQIAIMQGYRDFSRAFKVYELDDYLPNVPLKSAYKDALPKDVLKSLRKAVALTDRFIVSTEPLAEQFAGLHEDIRVVRNRLPIGWWGDLAGARRAGRKPRVGWGGGASHRGDLELIADVVRDLADEVEWVFFGMCPDKLRPYVHEFHAGVPIEQYPARLASLNLDLALAPLEDNLFNACKSNLRLLEYGACGFPVVCSDIACYRGELPVTRVKNRYKDWVGAIRMHLADLDATAKAGDALREAVHGGWMLGGEHLRAWRGAWLPG